MHYERLVAHGDPNIKLVTPHSFNRLKELQDFIKGRCAITDRGCWEWQGCKRGTYGTIMIDGRTMTVTRASKAAFHGFDPSSELWMLHTCDNPPCCNPDHLWPGTPKENQQDMINKGRQIKALGIRNGRAKLDDDKVLEIRRLSEVGRSDVDLSKLFGVSEGTIRNIRLRLKWQHV